MKQRLAIAMNLNDPEILILDNNKWIRSHKEYIQIQFDKNYYQIKGTTILLASHLLDEVEKVCSHVIVFTLRVITLLSRTVDGKC